MDVSATIIWLQEIWDRGSQKYHPTSQILGNRIHFLLKIKIQGLLAWSVKQTKYWTLANVGNFITGEYLLLFLGHFSQFCTLGLSQKKLLMANFEENKCCWWKILINVLPD